MSRSAAIDALRPILSSLQIAEALDVACGSGTMTRALAESVASFQRIRGVDVDGAQLREARADTTDRRIRFERFAAEALPYRDHRFDVVLMSYALHHVHDPETALREVERVRSPDGVAIVLEPVADARSQAQEASIELHHLKAEVDRWCGMPHRDTYSTADAVDLLRSVWPTCRLAVATARSIERAAIVKRLNAVGDYLANAHDRPTYAQLKRRLHQTRSVALRHGIGDPDTLIAIVGPDQSP